MEAVIWYFVYVAIISAFLFYKKVFDDEHRGKIRAIAILAFLAIFTPIFIVDELWPALRWLLSLD